MPRPGPRMPTRTFRLTDRQCAWLDAEAERLAAIGVTPSDIIRALIDAQITVASHSD